MTTHRWPTSLLSTVALCVGLATVPLRAHGQSSPRQVFEAQATLGFGEGLGGSPLTGVGGLVEFGPGQWVGLVVGGGAVIATPKAFPSFEQTAAGGQLSLAMRVYVRGEWPRGFGLGAALSTLAISQVGGVISCGEVFYRWVFGRGLALRIHADFGGLFLWDRAHPEMVIRLRHPSQADHRAPELEASPVRGFYMGVGLGIGWARGG